MNRDDGPMTTITTPEGYEIYSEPYEVPVQIYAKNSTGEFYAKDENGQEYPHNHAYARSFQGGQFYPKSNERESYSTFGNTDQKYAKDDKGNQIYAHSTDGSEYCAYSTRDPSNVYYYAKSADLREIYPKKGKKEVAITGTYTLSGDGEEFYPKIFHDSK